MTPGNIDRRLVVLTFTAAISTLTIACTGQDGASSRPEVSMTTADALSTEPTDPLEGHWFQDEVPCSVRRAAVIDAGFTTAEFEKAGRETCAAGGAGEYRFLDGRVIGIARDGTIGWDSSYEFADEDTVILDDGFDRITLDFTIRGNTLTLDVIRLTAPVTGHDLMVERVTWVAGAAAAPFTRSG